MSDVERVRIATSLALLIGIALSIGYAIYPYLYTIFEPLTPSGRDHRFEVVVNIDKPPDDPWGSGGNYWPFTLGYWSGMPITLYLSTSAGSFVTANLYHMLNITTFFSVLDLTTYYMIDRYTIRGEFMYSSSVTAEVRVITYNNQILTYIPSRSYTPNVMYRYSLTIPSYSSQSIVIGVPVRPSQSNRLNFNGPSITTKCAYLSEGATVTSTSDLSFTVVSVDRMNLTHVRLIWRIQFGSSWNGRLLQGCIVYTTDSAYINDVNSVPMRNTDIASPTLFLYHMYATTIYTGDTLTYVIWYVAPSTI